MLLLLLASTLIAAAAGVTVALRRGPAASPAIARILPADARAGALAEPAATRVVTPAITSLARRARAVTPRGVVEALETKLAAAGLQGTWTIEHLLIAKVVLGSLALLLTLPRAVSSPSLLTVLCATVLPFGLWYVPDFLASQRADARRETLRRELPDTMDQLTIAVEAGLGFEAALVRVASGGKGPLAAELRRTLQDIQLGVDRAGALDALGERCDVPDLRRFVAAVRQAERYGLPIASVLRTQASELRLKRRQRAEEHAMKIPVKVLFPMVLFILPTLFIVIIGPGVVRFLQSGGLHG